MERAPTDDYSMPEPIAVIPTVLTLAQRLAKEWNVRWIELPFQIEACCHVRFAGASSRESRTPAR